MKAQAKLEKLFEPFQIGKMTLRNRIVMSPMSCHFATHDGYVTERIKDYYEARAKGGAGLIVVEASCVDTREGYAVPDGLVIDNDKFIPGLSELAQVIKKHGAKAALQLIHAGKIPVDIKLGYVPPEMAASPFITPPSPDDLTVEQLAGAVHYFAMAAERARKAGFDAVEVHAITWFLLAMFLSTYTNHRKDAYGGKLENRARLLLEVIAAIKQKVPKDFPVWVKFNVSAGGPEGGLPLDEAKQVAKMLEDAGCAAIHLYSQQGKRPIYVAPWGPDKLPPMSHPPGYLTDLTKEVKKMVRIPVIAVGKIDPVTGEKVIREGKTDLVAIGRGMIADPDLANKAAAGRLEDITPCIACLACRDAVTVTHGSLLCSVNAAVGREREYVITPAKKAKKVVVVGGGPGGMEAARVAVLRGHKVTLYEKNAKLGGKLLLAARPPHKGILQNLTDYLSAQIQKLGVKVELGKEFNPELAAKVKPDAVVIASGSIPLRPKIQGIDGDNVVLAEDVLSGAARVGKKAVIIGGGLVGCETAEFLAEKGKKVTIVEILDQMGNGVTPTSRELLLDRLTAQSVGMLVSTRPERISEKGVALTDKAGKQITLEADTVVLAAGSRPNTELYTALQGKVPEIYSAGDSAECHGILEAIADGSRIGRAL